MKFIVESIENDLLTLKAPNANYRNTFKCSSAGDTAVGRRITGEIHAAARKIEAVSQGGNYVEPLFGRPRRMQGLVLRQNPGNNLLLVQTGYKVTVRLPPQQTAADYPVGSRVGWDNADWPEFIPEKSALAAKL
ncbi:MAG: hypothetical protein ACP5I8_09570 [Phycisphaerae bacterium]